MKAPPDHAQPGVVLPGRTIHPGGADEVVPGALLLRQVELANGFTDLVIPRSASNATYRAVQLLVRLHRRPLGMVTLPLDERQVLHQAEVADRVLQELHVEINRHLESDGLARVDTLPDPGIMPTSQAPCLYEHVLTPDRRPFVTVVVTTCNRPASLHGSLRSIFASSYRQFEVVVVENRPDGSTVAATFAEAFPSETRLRYTEEWRRGCSAARNRGLESAHGDLVVFTDDDVIVDRYWLAHLAEAFVRTSAACVTGLILPAELETPAQRLLEEFGGYAKGFVPALYDGAKGSSDPLYPFAAGRFGSGANTAVAASVSRDMGGFDSDLGAGTPSAGGEDLDLYIRLLRRDRRLAYEPAAIVWHRHHRSLSALARQLFHYGGGLSAAMTKQLVAEPGRRELLRRVPRGAAYLFRSDSPKNLGKSPRYPRVLSYAERCGIALGPVAYLRAVTSRRRRTVTVPSP